MRFKKPQVRYADTPQPATPYQAAGQVWDERIGSPRVQAKNWRLMAFGCLILSAGFDGGETIVSIRDAQGGAAEQDRVGVALGENCLSLRRLGDEADCARRHGRGREQSPPAQQGGHPRGLSRRATP